MKLSLNERSQQCIAQGCLTNSKHPKTHVLGVAPTHIVKALGARVWDESGKTYIDYIGGLGTNLIGYGNETVNRAAIQAMSIGISHSLGTQFEIAAAEKLKELLPFIERVKWVKTGSEACAAALKIARAVTGKRLVLTEGYHGWHEEFCNIYNGLGSPSIEPLEIDKITEHVAAVIVEPVMLDWSDDRREWLQALSTRCKETGTILIFDEVITNCRFPKYSVSSWANIVPDLICGGKAIANGFPLAYVAGKSVIMDNQSYFVSGTYNGDVVSLAAAHAVMTLLLSKKMNIEHLWQKGLEFMERFNALAQGYVQLVGYPTRGVLAGDSLKVAIFMQEAAKSGLLFGKSWNFSFCHANNETQDQTFAALEGIFAKVLRHEVKLEAPMPTSPLAAKARM